MFGIRLDSDLEARLGKIAKRDNRSKAFLIREAIVRYVEFLEYDESLYEARVSQKGGPADTVSTSKLSEQFEGSPIKERSSEYVVRL